MESKIKKTPQQKDRCNCELYSLISIIDFLEGNIHFDDDGTMIRTGAEIDLNKWFYQYNLKEKEYEAVTMKEAEEDNKNRSKKSSLRDVIENIVSLKI